MCPLRNIYIQYSSPDVWRVIYSHCVGIDRNWRVIDIFNSYCWISKYTYIVVEDCIFLTVLQFNCRGARFSWMFRNTKEWYFFKLIVVHTPWLSFFLSAPSFEVHMLIIATWFVWKFVFLLLECFSSLISYHPHYLDCGARILWCW